MEPADLNRYYLEVIKSGEKPHWPRPEEELVVGSQDLSDGYTQHWAYHTHSGKSAEDRPPAEVIASENTTPQPAILVDQPRPSLDLSDEEVLELVLVKDGHAWAKTSSSISNLEDNLTRLVTIASDQFGMEVEHFLTTDRVSEEVEKQLDSLEESDVSEAQPEVEEPGSIEEEEKSEVLSDVPESSEALAEEKEEDKGENLSEPEDHTHEMHRPMNQDQDTDLQNVEVPKATHFSAPSVANDFPIRHVSSQVPTSGLTAGKAGIYAGGRMGAPSSNKSSKLLTIILVLILLGVFGAGIVFRDQIFAKFSSLNPKSADQNTSAQVTSTPTPSPTPTPVSVDRSKFKIRVLNGTSVSGAAKTLGDKLDGLGWNVVKVGNNDDQEVSKGFVRMKKDMEATASALISDLGSNFELKKDNLLKSADTVDFEVVIGK